MEKKRVAKNGIEIYEYKNPALHGFFLSLFLRAGLMYEKDSEEGITHFLEHVLVRNVNKLSDMKLYEELDEEGLVFNASTYSEMVQFYASGSSDKLLSGGKILSKLFLPIILTGKEIDTERRRIKAEIRENDDKNSISSLASAAVFEGSPLAGSITGTISGVNRIGKAHLEEYRRASFTRENLFFYLSGNFSDEDADKLCELVGALTVGSGEKKENLAPVPNNFGHRGPKISIKNSDFTSVRFSFDMDMSSLKSTVADLIYDILLSGYSSPFFIEMSEERGLFYDISGSTEYYGNIGVFHFGFEVSERNLYAAVEAAVAILRDFKSRLLPDEKCMKAGYVNNAKLLLDDSRDYNFTFAYDNHILNVGAYSAEERAELYRGITPEDIRNGAARIFTPENLTLTLKGNKKRIDLQRIRELLIKL